MYNTENLKNLPKTFGVYIMKDKNNNIIYVGKANNIKNRVSQYFNGSDKRLKIENLRKEIRNIEYIVTSSELEALILENNLIKENKPKFNTLLKDDKTYPYIEITLAEEFPRILNSKSIKNNNSKYFGPFPDVKTMNSIIELLQKTYKIRVCNTFNPKGCIYYQIKKCTAPCMSKITKEDYLENINKCISILSGNTKDIIKEYTSKMYEASENLEFEKAGEYKKHIENIKYITSKQRITSDTEENEDLIVCEKTDKNIVVVVFIIRNGKIIGKEHFYMLDSLEDSKQEIITSFLKQYYYGNSMCPNKIILEEDILDKELIKNYLSTINNTKIEIIIPQKGDKKKLIDLAIQNAKIIINEDIRKEQEKQKKESEGIENLKKLLNLESLERIESFDISNTSGIENVASMIVFENGKPKKNNYRKFRLEYKGPNDYECMKEVIKRRFTDETLLKTLPNVLFIDGGKGQISVVKEVLDELKIDIPICGMVKDEKHNTRGLIFNEKELSIKPISSEFKLITNIQDETHNFAINYHRLLRNKEMTKSKLDNIKGIGDSKKKELFKVFGTIERIKEASIEELSNIKGISKELAKLIKDNL